MSNQINHNILYLLSIANRFAERKLNDALAPFHIKSGQVITLFLLDQHPGLTQKDICDLTGIEQPTIANTLKRMERDHLITRKSDEKDKRMIRNYLGDEIAQTIPQIRETMLNIEAQLLTHSNLTNPETMKLNLLKITRLLDPEWRFVQRWGSDLFDESET